MKKLRPYTDAELQAIRANYAMARVIDNKRLAEAGMPYRYDASGCKYDAENLADQGIKPLRVRLRRIREDRSERNDDDERLDSPQHDQAESINRRNRQP